MFDLEYQFFYGNLILVSPVTEDDAMSVSIYLPEISFTTLTLFLLFMAVMAPGHL